jgi:DNA-binding protein HU-beta
MTKQELVAKIATEAGISKVAAEKALGSFTSAVTESLKSGNKVTLVGFGTFSVSQRAARAGRNPQTNEVIHIPATKVPKFKPGKELKAAVK